MSKLIWTYAGLLLLVMLTSFTRITVAGGVRGIRGWKGDGGEEVRRLETVSTMEQLYNGVMNPPAEGPLTINVASGTYQCNINGTDCDAPSFSGMQMLKLERLSGSIACASDSPDSCVLDAQSSRCVMSVLGTNSTKLTLRALTFQNGQCDSGGGISIYYNSIIDIVLCHFTNCKSTGSSPYSGGGAIEVSGNQAIDVNIYASQFTTNSALFTRDILNYEYENESGSVTIYSNCPSPYESRTSVQGKMRAKKEADIAVMPLSPKLTPFLPHFPGLDLDCDGTVGGSRFSYSGCAPQERQVSDMSGIFNAVSSFTCGSCNTNTGTRIITNGDRVEAAARTYQCNETGSNCADIAIMLSPYNIYG